MKDLTPSAAFWRGLREAVPFLVILIPFAMLFGLIATEAGLSLAQTMSFSILVIAGASQFTAMQLLQDGASVYVALAASLAVNMRMAMYSAALTPHVGSAPFMQRALIAYFNVDQTFAMAQAEYEKRPGMSVQAKVAYFLGVATPICPPWYLFTWMGAEFGTWIPPEFALDFAVPIAFLAMIAPALRTLAHLAAALTSIVLALALVWLPSGVGVIVAGLVAMHVAARVELWMEQRS